MFTFIDLFAGIGGFRLAAESLGGKCVFTSEWDSKAQQTYQANFGEEPFGNIVLAETKESIPKKYDLLCAGFPCQPFSAAGLKKGFEETRGTLFFDILEILKETEPKMFLLENVRGLTSHDGGKTLEVIVRSLENLGYSIKWQILNSLDFGLPQSRQRWYCAGFRGNVDFSFPKGEGRGATIRGILDENADASLRLTRREIERINFHFSRDEKRVRHDSIGFEQNSKRERYGVYSFLTDKGFLRFYSGDRRKTGIQDLQYSSRDSYSPAIIVSRAPKLWDLQRKVSVLEAKRLQGFPDNFKFPVSNRQAYKQLGNSVSIPVVKAILGKMLEAFEKL